MIRERKLTKVLKVIRFIKIYGPSRTFTKVSARLRFKKGIGLFRSKVKKYVILIGL